jgi:hypothetical protein
LGIAIFILGYIKYEGLIAWLQMQYSQDKINQLKTEYLTLYTYKIFYYSLVSFWLLICVVLFLRWRKIETLALKIYEYLLQSKQIFSKFKYELFSLTIFQKIILSIFFVSLILIKLFFLRRYPFMYDEVFSYLHFVDKGFLTSALYYPGPNNHIFYSLLCVVSNFIFDDPVLIMRIPVLLVSVFTSLLYYACIRRFYDFSIAFLSVVVFSFSYNVFIYSIHGRGYTILFFLFLVFIYSFWKLTDEGESKTIYRLFFLTSGVLGLYTIPTFIYAYIPVVTYGFIYFVHKLQWQNLKKFIFLQVLLGGIVLILYGPILIINGMDKVTGNNWVAPLDTTYFWHSLIGYLKEIFNYLWNIEKYGAILSCIIFLSGIGVLCKMKVKSFALYLALIVLSPFIIICFQKVLPPPRIWDYLLMIFSFLFSLVINYAFHFLSLERIRRSIIVAFFIIIMVFHINYLQNEVKSGFLYFSSLEGFLEELFIAKPGSVYVKDDTFKLYLEYTAHEKEIPLLIYSEVNSENIDIVMLNPDTEFPTKLNRNHYQEYVNNAILKSYKKK